MQTTLERQDDTLDADTDEFLTAAKRVGRLAAEFSLAAIRESDEVELPGDSNHDVPGINAGFQSSD